MKLCSIIFEGKAIIGVLTKGGVADITALGFPEEMREIISGGPEIISEIANALVTKSLSYLDNFDFLPVVKPDKIICEGLNYKSHAEETGGSAPEHPVFFSKFNDALTSCDKPVTLPSWLRSYDYEAELVIVVGKEAYNVSTEEAEACIFGYTCGNDLSARDAQFLSSQWLSGKSLPGFAPVGPCIVTRDEFDPYKSHGVRCEVNGVTVQSGDTVDMIFGCRETLSAASKYFRLSPGDLIFTGTPAGVVLGKPKDERKWLKPGDTVKVTIDGIGTLSTPLV